MQSFSRMIFKWGPLFLLSLFTLPSGSASVSTLLMDQSIATPLPSSAGSDNEGRRRWAVHSGVELPVNAVAISTVANTQSGGVRDPLQDLTYRPDLSAIASIRVSYGEFGLSLSRRLGSQLTSNGVPEPGKTVETGIRASQLLTDHLFVEAFHHSLRGMETDLEISPGDVRTLNRPDVRLQTTGAQATWAIPLTSSAHSPTLLSLHGTPAAPDGLWGNLELLVGSNLSHWRMRGDRPFIPEERASHYGAGSTLSSMSSTQLGAGGGAAYSIGFGRSMVTTSLLAGPSFFLASGRFAEGEEKSPGVGFYGNWRLSYLHLGQKFTWGTRLAFDFSESQRRNISVASSYVSLLGHLGYRF